MDLRCIGIEKSFSANRALARANMSVRSGTIHALLGENGAGKSTLNNILSGSLRPDAGIIEIDGQPIRFASPLDAAACGIGMVHQHFLLAEALTVAENIALGARKSSAGLYFNRQAAETQTQALSASSGLQVDPRARVADLSVGMRQRVEILKALSRGAKLLLLDEPTAVLAPAEVTRLFETLRALRDEGRTLVIVTHKLDEVFALADAVTVLRRGVTVYEGATKSTSPAELAREMIGKSAPVLTTFAIPASHENLQPATVLTLRGVDLPGLLNIDDLQIRAGEIAGIAGVEGNGQTELAGLISGTLNSPPGATMDTLALGSVDLRSLTIQQRSDAGIASIPPDRQREGLVLELTLAENLLLRSPLQRSPRRFGISALDAASMKSKARNLLQLFGVSPPDPDLSAGGLSGGNQQKLIAARELSRNPKLIVACNPTRGLDVGAAAELQDKLLAAARQNNAAILLLSADLDEVLTLSDSVYALYKGGLTFVGPRGVSKEAVGSAMLGVFEKERSN